MATVIGLAKSHNFVMSLTILQPIGCSHESTTDFSHFLEKSNFKNLGVVGFVSKLDINT